MTKHDCLFCKIARKASPAEAIYEDAHAVAFLDVNPCSPGHTMVIPVRHAETLLELPESEIAPFFSAVKKVTRQLTEALRPDGFTIGINQGPASGAMIDHLHVHILPRFHDDGGGSVHSVVHNSPQESLGEIADKIRSNRQ